MFTKRMHKLIGIVLLVIVVAALGTGWAMANGDAVVYHACINDSSGTFHLAAENEPCNSNETRLVWNQQGPPGPDGQDGTNGLHCWDLNGNGIVDSRSEDKNGDQNVDVLDCRGRRGPQGPQGEQGPSGISGIADQICGEGESIYGFDLDGSILCSATGAPPEPTPDLTPTPTPDPSQDTGPECLDATNLVPGADLSGCDLSDLDLSGIDLKRATLHYAILHNTNLTEGNLSSVDLSYADLSEAILYNCEWVQEYFDADVVWQCTLSTDLTGVTWRSTTCPDGSNSNEDDGDGYTCLDNLILPFGFPAPYGS